MANTVKLKRRLTGDAGAPATLENGELAVNETTNTLYYGKGSDANGQATEIISLNQPKVGEPIFIVASGQSNMILGYPDPEAVYPRNMLVWNWQDHTETMGTEFVRPFDGRINTGLGFAREMALKYPESQVFLVNMGWGGQAIEHWLDESLTPAMWPLMTDNVNAALLAAGLTKANYFLWWQGEANGDDAPGAYMSKLEQFWARMKAEPWVDWYNQNIVYYGITGVPRLNWDGYTRVNQTIYDFASQYAYNMTLVRTQDIIDADMWEDDVHMGPKGLFELSKIAVKAVDKGRAPKPDGGLYYNPMTRRVQMTGNGLELMPSSYSDNIASPNLNTLMNYAQGFSRDVAITGTTTPGTATYTRQEAHFCRIGASLTATFLFVWTGHDGTGNISVTGLGIENYMGVHVPLNVYATGLGNTGPLMATWDVWTGNITIRQYNAQGQLQTVPMSEAGTLSISGSFIRLSTL